MKLFNRTKHEVYKNLAEGMAIRCGGGDNDKSGILEFLDIVKPRDDRVLITEYYADSLLKKGERNVAYLIYSKINPKKAAFLENMVDLEEWWPPERSEDIYDALDEIMTQYIKNDETQISWNPPFM